MVEMTESPRTTFSGLIPIIGSNIYRFNGNYCVSDKIGMRSPGSGVLRRPLG
jgi:hypothetical protein